MDTPGVLSGDKQRMGRSYDFEGLGTSPAGPGVKSWLLGHRVHACVAYGWMLFFFCTKNHQTRDSIGIIW